MPGDGPTISNVPGWVRDAVFYQIFPDRFAASDRVPKPGPLEDWGSPPTLYGFKGGDLIGIAEHLDYIADLGATALYLNPIFASASNHRYHTYDYLQVDPLLGGTSALRTLLDAAHTRGMRVVLDGVFNHASRGFWPFHHVLEAGAASPYRDWFYLHERLLTEGRPLRAYPEAPSAEPGWVEDSARAGLRSLEALGYRAWWDLPALPKLNVGNPEVRAYLLGVAEHWLEFGADGWRLDVPQEIDDPSFWEEFRARCRVVNPDAYLVGEIWHPAPEWVGEGGFDGLMNYPLAWALIGFAAGSLLDTELVSAHGIMSAALRPLDGQSFVARLEEILAASPASYRSGQLNLVGSHDTPRVLSVCGGDRDAVRLAILLMIALPGAPSIYYGDEIGMHGGLDPDCRRAFSWDDQNWDKSLFAFVRAALRLRRGEAALRGDSVRIAAADGMACAFERTANGSTLLVAANAADIATNLQVEARFIPAEPILATGPGDACWVNASQPATLELPARWAAIWRMA